MCCSRPQKGELFTLRLHGLDLVAPRASFVAMLVQNWWLEMRKQVFAGKNVTLYTRRIRSFNGIRGFAGSSWKIIRPRATG